MIIKLNVKCSDMCSLIIEDGNGKGLFEQCNYVPDFFPDEHYGDYLTLDIEVKTGRIINWTATESKVKVWIKRQVKAAS